MYVNALLDRHLIYGVNLASADTYITGYALIYVSSERLQ